MGKIYCDKVMKECDMALFAVKIIVEVFEKDEKQHSKHKSYLIG